MFNNLSCTGARLSITLDVCNSLVLLAMRGVLRHQRSTRDGLLDPGRYLQRRQGGGVEFRFLLSGGLLETPRAGRKVGNCIISIKYVFDQDISG